MKSKRLLFALMVCFLVLAAAGLSAAATNIVFYETKTSKTYKTETGYSAFKEALDSKGYTVQRIEVDLTREALKSYNPDVLVIPEISKDLTADELAAIFEFVMQDGKGLFVLGGGCGSRGGACFANQITIPFGMSLDEGGTLEDETSQIPSSKVKTDFVVNSVERQDATLRLLVQGVNTLGFFGGNGIVISGDAKRVASGDWDTYSPKSTAFPKGSKPPIAAAAIVGKGHVFLLSDADMLENKKLNTGTYKYDNLVFGTNIIDWLRSAVEKPDSKDVVELQTLIGQVHVDLDNMNTTLNNKVTEIAFLNSDISGLNSQLAQCNEAKAKLESQSFMGINYTTWAIGLLAIGFISAAVVVSQKNKKEEGKKEGDAGEFGYEFEEGAGDEGFGSGIEGFDDLMQMDEKAKKK